MTALLAVLAGARLLTLLAGETAAGGRGALALTAMAFGGHVRYDGPLLSEPAGVGVTAFPLTLTALGCGVLAWRAARGTAGLALPAAAARAAVSVLVLAGALAAISSAATSTGVSGDGSPLHYSASVLATVVGAVCWSAGTLAVVHGWRVVHAGHPQVPVALERWARAARPAAVVGGALCAVLLVAALFLVGYGGLDGGGQRVALLLAGAPNLVIGLLLVGFGVPLEVTASQPGLVGYLPWVSTDASFGAGSRAELTLGHVLSLHPAALLLPLLAAGVLGVGGCWLALGAADRAEAGRRAAALAGTMAVGAAVGAAIARLAGGTGGAAPLHGQVGFPVGLTLLIAACWGAAGGMLGVLAVDRMPAAAAAELRRRLRLPAARWAGAAGPAVGTTGPLGPPGGTTDGPGSELADAGPIELP